MAGIITAHAAGAAGGVCWWRVLVACAVWQSGSVMDLGSMSVKNLRSLITERGFSTLGLLTQDELLGPAPLKRAKR